MALAIQRKISEYNYYNSNNPQFIVIHDTGNYKDTAKDNVTYFAGGNRYASAHLFVDECSIWQSVEFEHGAWHCGDGAGKYGITNTNSIGIEMCNSGGYTSPNTIINTLSIVFLLMKKYNIPANKVVRHYDASRKICPNNLSKNNWTLWNTFANKVLTKDSSWGSFNNTETPSNNKNSEIYLRKEYIGERCKEAQQKLIALGYNCGKYGADGIFGLDTYNAVLKFQGDNGLTVDGYVGANTFKKMNELLYGTVTKGESYIIALQEECNLQGFRDKYGNKLNTDGLKGELTLSALPIIKEGAKGNITKIIQKRLNELGYDCGVPDGIFGSRTTKALKQFQADKSIKADGIIGYNTWNKLI